MTKPKKPKPNPIEEAIGDRTKPKTSEIPNEPTPSEMLTLEELNRRTEKRLQDDSILDEKLTPEEHRILNQTKPTTPVSKPDPQPATKTSSLASPPQDKLSESNLQKIAKNVKEAVKQKVGEMPNPGFSLDQDDKIIREELPKAIEETLSSEEAKPTIKNIKDAFEHINKLSAEDVELTALKKYILEDGFVVATVAFHIVSLCAQPMTTPSTTTWDFKDRAMIPDMVLALLNQPGYIEGIWPSLKIVMGSNKGNAAWSAGIATTIAFFDVIRTLPAIKEIGNETPSNMAK